MSRATSAVDMCSRIGPPCRAHAAARLLSAIRCVFSSALVSGNGNGGNTDTAWSNVSKQRSGVLTMATATTRAHPRADTRLIMVAPTRSVVDGEPGRQRHPTILATIDEHQALHLLPVMLPLLPAAGSFIGGPGSSTPSSIEKTSSGNFHTSHPAKR